MGHNEKGCSRTKRIPSKFNIIIVYHFLSKIKVGLTYFHIIKDISLENTYFDKKYF